MLNIPKENVKTFLLVVGGVAALVIISMIIDINLLHRNVFYKEDVDLTQYSNTAESKVQENKYELVSEGRRILFYTDEIMDMINNKEFDKLYNILDEKYRSLYVKSVKDLEEDMERFADGQYNLGYDEYYKEGNMFLIDARFEKINKTQEEIINSKATPIDTLCIREIEKGKYTVAFRGFIDKKEVNKETSNDLAKIKIKEMTVRSEEIELNIEVENLTNEKLNLYNSKLDIVLWYGLEFKTVNPNTIAKEIPANEKVNFKLTFRSFYSKSGLPNRLGFNKISGLDGNAKKISIKI